MPELPEVERARRLVDERIVGAVVVDVSRPVVDDKVFVDVEEGEFERALAGRAVVASARHHAPRIVLAGWACSLSVAHCC